MKSILNIIQAVCFTLALVGTVSSFLAVRELGKGPSSFTYAASEDGRTILGHRIDSNGQSQLVYED